MVDMPYVLTVFDKTGAFVGWVGNPSVITGGVRHGLVSTVSFTVAADHENVPDLLAPGARVELYREDEYQVGGWVAQADGTFAVARQLTFNIVDFYTILSDWTAWPKPGSPLTGQNVAYRTITGPAETVAKTVLVENAVRLGYPLTAAPNLGRGKVGTYSFRFHPIYDRLFPAFDQSGLGLTIRQGVGGLVVDCYEQGEYDMTLSQESGTIMGGSYSLQAPTATRVVVGGQGEGVLREFKGYPDLPREAAWGRIVEVFRDARDSESGDVYKERADETLAEGAARASLSLQLTETEHFRYGGPHGLRLGDKITAEINGQTITDTLREVQLQFDKDGDRVTPIVGERSDDPDVTLAKQLRALTRGNKERMAR